MIELKDVSFTYESGETENNLSHINLAIRTVKLSYSVESLAVARQH